MGNIKHNAGLQTAVVAGLLVWFGSAQAAMITHSDSFGMEFDIVTDVDEGSGAESLTRIDTLAFPAFDTSLGNLTDASISFTSNWSYEGTIGASDGGFLSTGPASGAGRATTALDVALGDPAGPAKNLGDSVTTSCSGNTGCNDATFVSGVFNGTLDLSGLSLDDFVTPVGGDVNVTLTKLLTAEITHCGSDDDCTAHNRLNDWTGSVDVKYTFDEPIDVPAPPVIVLFGVGLIGLGLAGARDRRRPT